MIINYLIPEIAFNKNLNKKKISTELRNAKFAVWMISNKNWLLDEAIYSLLLTHLKNGLTIEIVMHDYILSDYENAQLQVFIDAGGEIFLIDDILLNKVITEQYYIIDYSTIVAAQINNTKSLKPHRGSIFLKENQETLIESYIEDYLKIKNTYCKNRY